MHEKSILLYIERIEKKICRSNSDKLRLQELQEQVTKIQDQKRVLQAEFSRKQAQTNCKNFNEDKFLDILSNLKDLNAKSASESKAFRQAGSLRRQVRHFGEQELDKATRDLEATKSKADRVDKQVLENTYLIDGLKFKIKVLKADVDTIKKRLVEWLQINSIQEGFLKRIYERNYDAGFKQLFSQNVLNILRNQHNGNFFESKIEIFDKRARMEKQTADMNGLFDECANFVARNKSVDVLNKQLVEEIDALNKQTSEAEDFKRVKAFIERETANLRNLYTKIESTCTDKEGTNSELSTIGAKTLPESYADLASLLIKMYKTSIYTHEQRRQYQFSMNSRKAQTKKEIVRLEEYLWVIHKEADEKPTHNNDEELAKELAKVHLTRKSVWVLSEANDFFWNYAKRCQALITAINKICIITEYDYQVIIKKPFFISLDHNSHPSIHEMRQSKFAPEAVDAQPASPKRTRSRDSIELNQENECLIRWFVSYFPQITIRERHDLFDETEAFYANMLTSMSEFKEFISEIQAECKKNGEHVRTLLSKRLIKRSRKRLDTEKQNILNRSSIKAKKVS